MTHFGIISPPVSGHLHPFGALGRELQTRGHRVTCLQMLDVEDKVREQGIDFEPIGLKDHPRGSLAESLNQLGTMKGLAALRFTIRAIERTSVMVCRDAPAAIRAAGIEALLVDQMEPAGGAVAEHLRLPFITVCNALAVNRDAVAPPPFTPWQYRDAWWAGFRNTVGYAVSEWLTRPVTSAVATFRREWKLPPLRSPDDSFSRLAQICQMPREFDFPRAGLPESFHYVGPLRRPSGNQAPFPWDQLDGRPLIYSSLGTLQNNRRPAFQIFAEACKDLGVQLLINHVGGLSRKEELGFPGKPLVVAQAPQFEVLARARVTITHAGLNTVLDSLAHGVPMVALPITYEQPAIARRLERTGAGRSIPFGRLEAGGLRKAIEDVLKNDRYRGSAAAISRGIQRAGGVTRGADIIEASL